ncbi:Zinc finger BED domain-containing protein 1, partial [Camponotus floridanus]
MICKDLLPISTVEHEGFLTLLKILAPLYKPPSTKTMTKRLESRHDVMKQAFVKELQDADHYCLTCDNWTDSSNKSYLGVTIHYLQKSSKMKSGCLGCFPLHEHHTAEYLKQSLQQLFEEFNITTEKLTAIISDGEAAIKKACTEIVGKDKHIVCIAHVVAHLLPDALTKFPELTSIIEQIKSIVTLIRRSIPASDKLRELQLKAGKSEGTALSLIQDVPIRWTTKVDAIERYMELEPYIYAAMSECANPIDVLNREQIKILNDIFPLMKPIRDVIKEISGDSYPTCSIIIPIIHCMRKKIDDVNLQTEIGKNCKIKIQAAISQRFKNFEHVPLLSMATILDPRFKKVHFKDVLAVYPAISRINAKLKDFKSKTPEHLLESQTEKLESIWDFHDTLELKQKSISNASKNLELEQYLQLERIPRKDDIFMYWKSVETTFPSLSKLALRHLSVIGTSVPCERLFSKAGLIKRDNRNRLTSRHLNMLVFL